MPIKIINVNTAGKLVLDRTYSFSKDSPKTTSLDLSNLSQGMYLLKIESNGNNTIKRIVIGK